MSAISVKRVDHVSFTVGDLDRSVAFFGRFGLTPLKSYRSEGPDVDEGTATEDASMDITWLRLRHAEAPMLELIRYRNYPAERSALNSRVGAAHVCFEVDDVRGAYSSLRADGVEFLSEPHTDAAGTQWVYMRDPDGNVVELIEEPSSDSGL
jgi:catechol 2,3-dioxygenase-like lactoylglutathione lyase family enzyme